MELVWKKREIDGETCDWAVYGTQSRFLVNGNYYAEAHVISTEAEEKARKSGINVRVEVFGDGSASVFMQKLLPWDTDEDELEDKMDEMLTKFENAVGLTEEDESSMSWNIGHSNTDYDDLMTSEEQSIVK